VFVTVDVKQDLEGATRFFSFLFFLLLPSSSFFFFLLLSSSFFFLVLEYWSQNGKDQRAELAAESGASSEFDQEGCAVLPRRVCPAAQTVA